MSPAEAAASPVAATAFDTVDEIVRVSKRRADFPIRVSFLQSGVGKSRIAGPFSGLVRAGDKRALVLYLLALTKASAEPWDASLPAAVWARAIGLDLPESKTARSAISKAWLRLERLNLLSRGRKGRRSALHLLKEDGSGEPYSHPGSSSDRYFRVPLEIWREPSDEHRWYQELDLPEMAVLLIGLSLGERFLLPTEKSPAWYGISADTVSRGISGLANKGLLLVETRTKLAPLSPAGVTQESRYTLQAPFHQRPAGRRTKVDLDTGI